MYISSPQDGSALRQCELLSNVTIPTLHAPEGKEQFEIGDMETRALQVKYAIIISQDCDLSFDFNAQTDDTKQHKLMRQVLLCEMQDAEEKVAWARKHDLYSSKKRTELISNRDERFYFFPVIDKEVDALETGMGEMIADFKLIYAVESTFLYQQLNQSWGCKRRVYLDNPHKEHFTQRFHQWHGRVGLPEQYTSV